MGISVTKLLIVLAIILVLFGTKRLRNIGSDLGEAIKNFRLSMKEGENEKSADKEEDSLEGETTAEKNDKK
ncbi:MAG: Sec-independent protein translocase subunit TatA [Methylosarcina sp.]|jgi:sec-independent protein translocase protein TatA